MGTGNGKMCVNEQGRTQGCVFVETGNALTGDLLFASPNRPILHREEAFFLDVTLLCCTQTHCFPRTSNRNDFMYNFL